MTKKEKIDKWCSSTFLLLYLVISTSNISPLGIHYVTLNNFLLGSLIYFFISFICLSKYQLHNFDSYITLHFLPGNSRFEKIQVLMKLLNSDFLWFIYSSVSFWVKYSIINFNVTSFQQLIELTLTNRNKKSDWKICVTNFFQTKNNTKKLTCRH